MKEARSPHKACFTFGAVGDERLGWGWGHQGLYGQSNMVNNFLSFPFTQKFPQQPALAVVCTVSQTHVFQ